ncbi:MAG: tRNA uridine(34) 5-carboxymethylaminomethyl modification radical SAM/GNAT enzyme Elp3 [Candidatus Woesearchaeota archaeon]
MNKVVIKPVRTQSGITPVTVVAKPFPCPHGRCTYCPGGVKQGTPNSYTTHSPAIMRAITLAYDPYKQIQARLKALQNMGHPTSKVEIIILGGTFLAYPIKYQYDFIKAIYDSLNQKKSKTLEQSKKLNEKAKYRCVALCIETKPDWSFKEHINRMLDFGCTRVELGIQIINDKVYEKIHRGHTVADVIKSTKLLKDSGFKVGYHIMPGLPGSNLKKDLKLFNEIFSNQDFKPDQLKIYPLQIMHDTPLERSYLDGKFKLYKEKDMIDLICNMKALVPEYCRIMRIVRQFHPIDICSDKLRTNTRIDLIQRMKELGLKCKCIRCREIGLSDNQSKEKPKLKIKEYNASNGKEFFLSFETKNNIFGLCRARIPSEPFRGEITKRTLIIRELHVYGQQIKIKEHQKGIQHTGLGKKLMEKAEEIAKKNKCNKIVVISGVGVREYYKNLGYKQDGPYVSKYI